MRQKTGEVTIGRISNLGKVALTGIFAATTLAACASPTIIGPNADKDHPELRGRMEDCVSKADTADHCLHVNGSDLQSGGYYKYEGGSLIIDGNVPDKTRIEVYGGNITVTGNVGSGSTLVARVPMYEHTETRVGLMPISNGKTVTMMPYTYYVTIEDGPKAPYDTNPVIVVYGSVGKDVQLAGGTGTYTMIMNPAPAPAAKTTVSQKLVV